MELDDMDLEAGRPALKLDAATERELQALVARGRARPVLDDRTEDEILGYDAAGLPQ